MTRSPSISPASSERTPIACWRWCGWNPELGEPLCPHGPDIIAQAVHAVRDEGARTVADVLLRRTPCGWNRCRGLDAAPAVARMLAAELGWDECAEADAVAAYRAEVDATLVPLGGAVCINTG